MNCTLVIWVLAHSVGPKYRVRKSRQKFPSMFAVRAVKKRARNFTLDFCPLDFCPLDFCLLLMALIECPACVHDVSDQAVSCPNCGHPIKARARLSAVHYINGGAAVVALGVIVALFVWVINLPNEYIDTSPD